MAYVITAQNKISVTCSNVPNCSYFVSGARLEGRNVQNYEKWSFFSAFSRLDPFPHIFLADLGILQLHKTIRVLHVVPGQIVFIWFYDQHWQGEVLKFRSCFSIFSRLDPFAQVFWLVKEWLMLKLYKITRVLHVVACPIVFFFISWVRLAVRSGHSYEKWSFFSIFSCLGSFP